MFNPKLPSPFPDGGIIGRIIDKLHPLIPDLDLRYLLPDIIGGIKYPVTGPLSSSLISTVSQPVKGALQERASTSISKAASNITVSSGVFGSSAQYRKSLDIKTNNVVSIYSRLYALIRYKFSLFYHPFVKEFLSSLNRDGINRLL